MLDVGAVLSGLKHLTPKVFSAVALFSGALLFSSESLLVTAGLTEFVSAYRTYLGAALFGSLALLLTHSLAAGWKYLVRVASWGWEQLQARRLRERREQMLSELTPAEKHYLLPYIRDDANTQYFDLEDGIASGLAGKGVIFPPTKMLNIIRGLAYNIAPWAKAYLKRNPHLLDGAQLDRKPDRGRI